MALSIDPKSIDQPVLHNYLLTAVAPRPIALASTIDKEGRVNLSPFSFFNVFSSNPPIMIFSPARRGRDNTTKHTYENIKAINETVINIVNYPIVEQMSLSSTEYPEGVNEFTKAGFTEVASKKVKPPRVKEAPVSFECKVDQVIELGKKHGAGNLIIARVVMMHFNEEYLDANNMLDTQKLDLVGRMGGSWYTRSSGDSLFEIPKPLRTMGIGVDALPESIRNSGVLTGNNLGRLGNIEQFPTQEFIEEIKTDPVVKTFLTTGATNSDLHRLAKRFLDKNETEKAMAVLMIAQKLFG